MLKAVAASLVVPPKLFTPKSPTIVRSGFLIRGGMSSPSGDTMTQFLATLADNEWGSPANTTASPIYYSNDTGAPDYDSTKAIDNQGTQGSVSVWRIWNGGAHDTNANRALLQGGGHLASCDDAIYAFDFATCSWSRITTPNDFPVQTGMVCSNNPGTFSWIYPNGDPSAFHNYSGEIFLPDQGAHGSFALFPGDTPFGAILDLSKAAPYTALPTTLGAPGSGWKATVSSGTANTTPAVCGYDQATGRIWILNQQIGGGPPLAWYYDIATDGYVNPGGNFPGLPQVPGFGSYFAGCVREGHREIWGFGYPDGTGHDSCLCDMITGDGSTWQTTNLQSIFSDLHFPGSCYLSALDAFAVWSGGNNLAVVDCATKVANTIVTTGTVPAQNADGSNNGAMTKLFADSVHKCLVLCYDGDNPVYVLKAPSLF